MWLYHYWIGSWSNDSGDGNKNGKKAIGLQNNNFAGAFFCARGSALFHVLSRTQDNDFLFLFLNFDNSTSTIQQFSTKFANIWRIERVGINAIKFEVARIHILSNAFEAVAVVFV